MSAPPPPPTPESGGRRRGCLIAAVVTVLVLLVGCVGGCWMIRSNVTGFTAWGLERGREAFEQQLAQDVTPELREEFRAEFDAYLAHLRGLGKDADPEKVRQAVTIAQRIAEATQDQSITAAEVQSFIDASREVRGAQ